MSKPVDYRCLYNIYSDDGIVIYYDHHGHWNAYFYNIHRVYTDGTVELSYRGDWDGKEFPLIVCPRISLEIFRTCFAEVV